MRKEYASGKTIEATTGYIAKLKEDGEYEVFLTDAFRKAVDEAVSKKMTEIAAALEPLTVLPETDGTYTLTCEITDGEAEFTWDSAEV